MEPAAATVRARGPTRTAERVPRCLFARTARLLSFRPYCRAVDIGSAKGEMRAIRNSPITHS